MDTKKETKKHLKIGLIGNPQCGRARLIEEISKILKEENNKKFKDETKSQLPLVDNKKFLQDKDFKKLND